MIIKSLAVTFAIYVVMLSFALTANAGPKMPGPKPPPPPPDCYPTGGCNPPLVIAK